MEVTSAIDLCSKAIHSDLCLSSKVLAYSKNKVSFTYSLDIDFSKSISFAAHVRTDWNCEISDVNRLIGISYEELILNETVAMLPACFLETNADTFVLSVRFIIEYVGSDLDRVKKRCGDMVGMYVIVKGM